MASMRCTMLKNPCITQSQSVTLVKNLFRAAFSSVAYVRNLFDAQHFVKSKIGTTPYYRIIDNGNEEVRRFVNWLEDGVFDALQNKYLDAVNIEIYAMHNNMAIPKRTAKEVNNNTASKALSSRQLLECYSFQVCYKKGEPLMQLSAIHAAAQNELSKEGIKLGASEVVRCLIGLTHALPPLPMNRIVSVKLLFKKGTPEEYQPPMFSKCDEDGWFDEMPIECSAGTVVTPYHHLEMKVVARDGEENRKMQLVTTASGPSREQAKDKIDSAIVENTLQNWNEQSLEENVGGNIVESTQESHVFQKKKPTHKRKISGVTNPVVQKSAKVAAGKRKRGGK